MPSALITGSGGLIGSQCVADLSEAGFDVVGIDNDMRALLFGADASTTPVSARLLETYPTFRLSDVDVRDAEGVRRTMAETAPALVVHAAAQPSHDWARQDPITDFAINAQGTLHLLEAARVHCPEATFVFMSTNKVYGDRPNDLSLVETPTRLDLSEDHPYFDGVDTTMSIDRSMHSIFGASKVAADVLVQEYGRYFDMPTVCLRAGCLSGPGHAGTELHGFLSYLTRCAMTGARYTVHGYAGKQVRDNLHAADVVQAISLFHESPRPGAVYNLGGGRPNAVSVLEAIELCGRVAGNAVDYDVSDKARLGDHRWWISDSSEFRNDYPAFEIRHGVEDLVEQIAAANGDRWRAAACA